MESFDLQQELVTIRRLLETLLNKERGTASRRQGSIVAPSTDAGIPRLAAYWAGRDLYSALEEFIWEQTSSRGLVRFSWPQLCQRLAAGTNLTRSERNDLLNLCLELGMVEAGKSRVNVGGRMVHKDKAFDLPEPTKWLDALCARLTPA